MQSVSTCRKDREVLSSFVCVFVLCCLVFIVFIGETETHFLLYFILKNILKPNVACNNVCEFMSDLKKHV